MENSCWVNCCRFELLCPAPGFTAYWLSLTLPVPQVPNYDINKVTLPDTGLLEDHILYDRDFSLGPDTLLTRTVSDRVCPFGRTPRSWRYRGAKRVGVMCPRLMSCPHTLKGMKCFTWHLKDLGKTGHAFPDSVFAQTPASHEVPLVSQPC